jgi:exosortase A
MSNVAMRDDRQIHHILARRDTASRWTPTWIVVLLLAWVLAAYAPTTWSMITIWERSETFAHGFLVIPIVLYLLWRNRAASDALVPRPFLPALAGILVAGAVWFVASRLRVNSVAQVAMIATVPLAVWATLGTAALRLLAFPLAFLFFAVPIGEFLMPMLVDRTADVTIAALRLTGVPVFREGNFFTIPSGRWSVVEACSGLRYLIASLMVGCLFAYLTYRTARRRAMFVACAIVVPILANWMRAYMIVMLGHLSGNRIAVGVDHLVYGWLFFGIVMVLLFFIGARWREDLAPAPARESAAAPQAPIRTGSSFSRVLVITLALVALVPLVTLAVPNRAATAPRPVLAVAASGGWHAAPGSFSQWRPDVEGFTSFSQQAFDKDGNAVGLIIAYFGDASSESKPITSTNQLVRSTNRQWHQVGAGTAQAVLAGAPTDVRTAVVSAANERLAVWQWFWVDGKSTGSEVMAAIYQALALLRGRNAPVAWVVVYTPIGSEERDPSPPVLSAFVAAMHGAIETALSSTAAP